MTFLILAAAMASAATNKHPVPHPVRHARRAASTTGRIETLHVAAIDLDDQAGTGFTLKDAAGVKLEPVKVPLSICPKDHLGRLLPGLDVQMVVERKTGADGKPVRFVRPERFRPWCS